MRKVKANPRLSAQKLVGMVKDELQKNVSTETVRKIIRKNNYNGRVARKKSFINEWNRKKRLSFAKKHKNEDFNFWKHVIFTDESKFNIFGSDGRQMVWRRPNEELKAQNL